MNFPLVFLLLVKFFAWSQGMLYRRDSDNILKPAELTADITKQVDRILKREINEVTKSVQYLSDKVDECLENTEALKQIIKELEKKNMDLKNKNVHLENRINSLATNFIFKIFNLQPVSSTVEPLPFYSVYGFEKKLRESKYKKRPQGKVVLLTKSPK